MFRFQCLLLNKQLTPSLADWIARGSDNEFASSKAHLKALVKQKSRPLVIINLCC